MSAHTPGPWRWAETIPDEVWEVRGSDTSLVAEIPLNGMTSPEIREMTRADVRLMAAAPDGLAAAKDALAWLKDPDADANEEFERIGEEFYRDTGMLRPGKSVPLEMGGPSEQERSNRFAEWCMERSRKVREALAAFVAKAEGRLCGDIFAGPEAKPRDRNRPCVLAAGHDGDHRDADSMVWGNPS